MKKLITNVALAVGVAGVVGLAGTAVYAATTATSELSQTINAGVLSTDIRDTGDSVVTNPTFAMNATTASTSAQTTTGTFGANDKRIAVDNNTYQYNGNATTGQLTVNPAAGTLTSMIGASTGITLGSQAAFSGTSPVTLISAAAGSDDVWRGYVTGVGLSQAIPAGQAAGTYTLPMTQTVAAI